MKRAGNLFESILEYQNIRLAFLKTVRRHSYSRTVLRFCENTDRNLALLQEKLRTLRCDWGHYRSFLIADPKLRVINTAPIEQRIMHHAIMNVLEDTFERPMIYHSYACRKGKGVHRAVRYAFTQCRKNTYFLKLDIRSYFNSIDHGVLQRQLRRLVKDPRVLRLFEAIIGSYETETGKGLPIGNLTSQYCANVYLADMDHYILEKLRPSGYCRYMDDIAVWAHSQAELQRLYVCIGRYAGEKLGLTLKAPVFGKTGAGLPFLGFLIQSEGIYLLRKSKDRITKRMRAITALLNAGVLREEKAGEYGLSVLSWVGLARTNRFRRNLLQSLQI